MRFLLALRAIFFVLLLPGTVAGYVPFRILSAADQVRVPELSLSSAGASIVAIAGAVVLLRCVWDFFAKGKGTLAPIDPPRVLVVSGLYRFTRNPMYNGVLALILGEAWLFGSMSLLKYALLVFVLFHLFVVFYEEPALTSQFGESYRVYRRALGLHHAAISRGHREHRLTCRCSRPALGCQSGRVRPGTLAPAAERRSLGAGECLLCQRSTVRYGWRIQLVDATH